jgi:GcrA cell cycle regulator
MSDAVWTELMMSELRTMWDAGWKASAIAEALGISKNAVFGKAHRLELASRPSPIRTSVTPKAQVPSKTERTAALKLPDGAKRAAAAPIPKPAPRERPPAEGCRWPMWAFAAAATHKYCGEPRTDVAEPYCAAHRAIAFTPIKRLVAA